MARVWVRVPVGLAALALACAPGAAASTSVAPSGTLEPGVTVDEGSPAAKEYALALTQARHTGSSSKRAGGSSSEAPFGAGIKPPPSSSGGGGSAANGAPPAARTHAHAGATRTAGAAGRSEPASSTAAIPAGSLRADRASAPGGEGSLLALIGGGVAILVLGALGGVVLRHSRRPPSHA